MSAADPEGLKSGNICFDETIIGAVGSGDEIERFFERHYDLICFEPIDWRKIPNGRFSVTLNWSPQGGMATTAVSMRSDGDGTMIFMDDETPALFTLSFVKHLNADFPGINRTIHFLGEHDSWAHYPDDASDEDLLVRIAGLVDDEDDADDEDYDDEED